jgi:pimeloyl-ACP methyl ester carboxylesterase
LQTTATFFSLELPDNVMAPVKTIKVPHLFGTSAGYQMPRPYNPSLPTCILVNSFSMTSDLYKAQFEDERLLERVNIIAIEPYGHGQTRAASPTFTYWDTATMNLQVVDAMGIQGKVFALGTSQGSWIVRLDFFHPAPLCAIGLTPVDSNRSPAWLYCNRIESLVFFFSERAWTMKATGRACSATSTPLRL